ncbi:MAG: aminotransferase class IV [Chloroflexota bacterium]
MLYTAGEGVLEGITRKIILQLAAGLGIASCGCKALPVDEIDTLDEAALSGSSRAFLPVVRIGEQVVGNGRPGPISRQLLAAYYAFLAREIRPAVVDK